MTVKDYRVQSGAELRTRVVDYREHRDIEHMISHGWGYVGGQCWAASSNDLDEADQPERKLFLPRLSEELDSNLRISDPTLPTSRSGRCTTISALGYMEALMHK